MFGVSSNSMEKSAANSNNFRINPNPNDIVYNQEILNSFANLKLSDTSNNGLILGSTSNQCVMAQARSEFGYPFSKGDLLLNSENENMGPRFSSGHLGVSEQCGMNSLLEQLYGLNSYSEPRFRTMGRENGECYLVRENRGFIGNENSYSGARFWTMGLENGARHLVRENNGFIGNEYGSISYFSNYKEMEELLSVCSGSIPMLMVDGRYDFLFKKLVDGCEGLHLDILVAEVFSDSSFLIDAAFTTQGSISIKQLIRKLKESHHAFILTKILSTRLFEMATHHIAMHVINECLHVFGSEQNEVLHEQVIQCCANLAVHILGCRFLNECIHTNSGYNREKLLFCIADSSDYLSNDAFGNYVVQFVLALGNRVVNEIIFSRLKGQFVSLAMKKGGSHIVERCLECCEGRANIVINEILQFPMGPYLLAKDQFGNYVIQKALDLSKKQGLTILYESLARALRPYSIELNQSPGGRNVISVLSRNS